MEEHLNMVHLHHYIIHTTHIVVIQSWLKFFFSCGRLVTRVFFLMQQDEKLGKDTILDETEYPLQIFRDWPADRGKKQNNIETDPHSLIHKVAL